MRQTGMDRLTDDPYFNLKDIHQLGNSMRGQYLEATSSRIEAQSNEIQHGRFFRGFNPFTLRGLRSNYMVESRQNNCGKNALRNIQPWESSCVGQKNRYLMRSNQSRWRYHSARGGNHVLLATHFGSEDRVLGKGWEGILIQISGPSRLLFSSWGKWSHSERPQVVWTIAHEEQEILDFGDVLSGGRGLDDNVAVARLFWHADGTWEWHESKTSGLIRLEGMTANGVETELTSGFSGVREIWEGGVELLGTSISSKFISQTNLRLSLPGTSQQGEGAFKIGASILEEEAGMRRTGKEITGFHQKPASTCLSYKPFLVIPSHLNQGGQHHIIRITSFAPSRVFSTALAHTRANATSQNNGTTMDISINKPKPARRRRRLYYHCGPIEEHAATVPTYMPLLYAPALGPCVDNPILSYSEAETHNAQHGMDRDRNESHSGDTLTSICESTWLPETDTGSSGDSSSFEYRLKVKRNLSGGPSGISGEEARM
ncbi:hypothetical protein C8R43DRAFT_953848 [Mycena crocata]|nr:hypothetical protein C8R43DRAFT_953848 [Mycena crocata]